MSSTPSRTSRTADGRSSNSAARRDASRTLAPSSAPHRADDNDWLRTEAAVDCGDWEDYRAVIGAFDDDARWRELARTGRAL